MFTRWHTSTYQKTEEKKEEEDDILLGPHQKAEQEKGNCKVSLIKYRWSIWSRITCITLYVELQIGVDFLQYVSILASQKKRKKNKYKSSREPQNTLGTNQCHLKEPKLSSQKNKQKTKTITKGRRLLYIIIEYRRNKSF